MNPFDRARSLATPEARASIDLIEAFFQKLEAMDFEAVGGFDEQFYAGEEMHLSRALKGEGRFVIGRERVVTSGRKFRTYPLWKLLAPGFRFLFRGNAAVTSREGLGIWYEGKREE